MIILRHKEFSTPIAKAAMGKEKVLNLFKRGAKKKTQMQMRRSAIKTQDDVIEKTAKTINNLNEIAFNPGEGVRKGIKFTAENPITATTQIGGKVLMVTNPETAALPIGAAGTAAEVALKKKSGMYRKGTQKLGRFFDKDTKTGRAIESGANAVYNSLRNFV